MRVFVWKKNINNFTCNNLSSVSFAGPCRDMSILFYFFQIFRKIIKYHPVYPSTVESSLLHSMSPILLIQTLQIIVDSPFYVINKCIHSDLKRLFIQYHSSISSLDCLFTKSLCRFSLHSPISTSTEALMAKSFYKLYV